MDIRKVDKEMLIYLAVVWAIVIVAVCAHAPGIFILLSIVSACLFTRLLLLYTEELDRY